MRRKHFRVAPASSVSLGLTHNGAHWPHSPRTFILSPCHGAAPALLQSRSLKPQCFRTVKNNEAVPNLRGLSCSRQSLRDDADWKQGKHYD